MIHTTTMIFILKNTVALEIKTAREGVVALEVECMVVWVGHHPWAEVDGLDLVLVETWVLDPVVLGEEWGKKTILSSLHDRVFSIFIVQLLTKGTHGHSLVKKGNGIIDWSSCPFLYRNIQFDTQKNIFYVKFG
jgi:hypothetical protein